MTEPKPRGRPRKSTPPDYQNERARWTQAKAVEAELKIATEEQKILDDRLKPMVALRKDFVVLRQEYTWIIEEITKERAELDTWQKSYTIIQTDLAAEVAAKLSR